jgi:hypothetical protein
MIVSRQIIVSAVDSLKETVFSRGIKQVKFESLGEGGLRKFKISQPFTNQDLMAGSSVTSGVILYIESDAEIVVKLDNTGDTGFTIKPISSTEPGILYLEGTFTHVYATGVGAVDANIVVGIVGAGA